MTLQAGWLGSESSKKRPWMESSRKNSPNLTIFVSKSRRTCGNTAKQLIDSGLFGLTFAEEAIAVKLMRLKMKIEVLVDSLPPYLSTKGWLRGSSKSSIAHFLLIFRAIKGTIQADIIEGSAIFLLSEVQSFVEERERLRAQEELYQADQRALRGHQVLRDRLGLGHQNAIDDSKVEDGGETSKQIHDRLKRRLERLSQSAEAAVNASTVPVLEPRPARVSFKKASGIVMVPLEPSLLD